MKCNHKLRLCECGVCPRCPRETLTEECSPGKNFFFDHYSPTLFLFYFHSYLTFVLPLIYLASTLQCEVKLTWFDWWPSSSTEKAGNYGGLGAEPPGVKWYQYLFENISYYIYISFPPSLCLPLSSFLVWSILIYKGQSVTFLPVCEWTSDRIANIYICASLRLWLGMLKSYYAR